MTKKLSILVLAASLISIHCSTDSKKELSTRETDEQRNAYNDILTELVTRHFYKLYLGQGLEKLNEKYIYRQENPDTISYDRELQNLQNIVASDSSKQSIICLRMELLYGPWTYRPEDIADSLIIPIGLTELLANVSPNLKGIYDSLKTPQHKYSAKDFHAIIFKISAYKNFKDCEIGVISFSKIFFNEDRAKGLLYYEFVCGGKCGKGEIILLEKRNEKWVIAKREPMWIS